MPELWCVTCYVSRVGPRARVPLVQPVTARASLTDQAVAAIRSGILSGELAPGELTSVYQLSERLGVSRTPVREAVLRLVEAGMLRFERNKGIRVLRTSVHDVQEVFQLRLLLEVPAAARAARWAPDTALDGLRARLAAMRSAAGAHDEEAFMAQDRALHAEILTAAGNGKLVAVVARLREATATLGASTADRSRSLDDIADEHEPLVEAVCERDAERAAATMRAHLVHTGGLLLDQLVRDGRDPGDVDPGWAEAFVV